MHSLTSTLTKGKLDAGMFSTRHSILKPRGKWWLSVKEPSLFSLILKVTIVCWIHERSQIGKKEEEEVSLEQSPEDVYIGYICQLFHFSGRIWGAGENIPSNYLIRYHCRDYGERIVLILHLVCGVMFFQVIRASYRVSWHLTKRYFHISLLN